MENEFEKQVKKEERKGSIRYFDGGSGRVLSPEERIEMRKQMPEKLNGVGRWFFSGSEPLIVVNNPEAVYGKC